MRGGGRIARAALTDHFFLSCVARLVGWSGFSHVFSERGVRESVLLSYKGVCW